MVSSLFADRVADTKYYVTHAWTAAIAQDLETIFENFLYYEYLEQLLRHQRCRTHDNNWTRGQYCIQSPFMNDIS